MKLTVRKAAAGLAMAAGVCALSASAEAGHRHHGYYYYQPVAVAYVAPVVAYRPVVYYAPRVQYVPVRTVAYPAAYYYAYPVRGRHCDW